MSCLVPFPIVVILYGRFAQLNVFGTPSQATKPNRIEGIKQSIAAKWGRNYGQVEVGTLIASLYIMALSPLSTVSLIKLFTFFYFHQWSYLLKVNFRTVFSVEWWIVLQHQKMGETVAVNFQTCCRLCLSDKADVLKSVFDESTEDRSLLQKISQFIAIQVCKFTVFASILFMFSS